MKKLILLFAAATCSLGAFAQMSVNRSVVLDGVKSFSPVANARTIMHAPKSPLNSALKTTGATGGGKWFFHEPIIDGLLGGEISSNNLHSITNIWWDSTVTERFSNGVFSVNFAGVCEQQDPKFKLYSDTTLYPSSDIKVTSKDAYTVDSVQIYAIYNHVAGHNKKDTLIIGVAPQHFYVYWAQSNNSWIHNNPSLPTADTELYAFMPYYTDSVHRAAFSDSTGIAATLDTIVLDPTTMGEMVDPATSSFDSVQVFTFPVNAKGIGGHTGCAVPPGFNYAITVAFKSGDTWKANVDSVEEFNDFEPYFGYQGSTTGTTWMTNWYQDYNSTVNDTSNHDDNQTSLLDARGQGYGPDEWVSTYAEQALENTAGAGFPLQYAFIGGHVNCPTCNTIAASDTTTDTTHHTAVNNVSNIINNVSAYPSPANDVVFVPFTLAQHANVIVTLTNTIGQIVKTQNMGNVATGKAQFNVADLPSGVYFYSLNANEQRTTGRVLIAH